jgi:hypothetical protein
VFVVQKKDSSGSFVLYPLSSGKYLVAIYSNRVVNTEAGEVHSCAVEGSAQKEGDGLRVTVPTDSGALSFHASLRDPETFVVEHSHEVGVVEDEVCGSGATIALTFTRRGPFFN